MFNEDHSTVRKDHAPQNMAIVRHVVLNMLNTAKKKFKGVGVKETLHNSLVCVNATSPA